MRAAHTLHTAWTLFSDPERCRQLLMEARWPDGKVRCPHCDSDRVTYLSAARLWKCYRRHPRAKFSLKVGTVFEDSPLGLDKWLVAVWFVANAADGRTSSYELARAVGVTQKTAWWMLHRIRLAMDTESFRRLPDPGPDGPDGTAGRGRADA